MAKRLREENFREFVNFSPAGLLVFTFLIPTLIILSIWQANKLRLISEDVWPAATATYVFIVGFLLLLRWRLKSWQASAWVALLFVAYVFYSPTLFDSIIDSKRVGIIVAVLGLILVFDIARRTLDQPKNLAQFTRFANILAIPIVFASLLAPVFEIAAVERGRMGHAIRATDFSGAADDASPDVWHIYLDRYANAETLRDVYGFDNSEFLSELEERGFYVSPKASSNYQKTSHSLASTLNAMRLSAKTRGNSRTDDYNALFQLVRDNAAARFFKNQGYRTIHAGSWAEISRRYRHFDEDVIPRNVGEFGHTLLNKTLFGRVGSRLGVPWLNSRDNQCKRVPEKFDELRRIAKASDRKYVLAHFLVPHPPYIFDEKGRCSIPTAN